MKDVRATPASDCLQVVSVLWGCVEQIRWQKSGLLLGQSGCQRLDGYIHICTCMHLYVPQVSVFDVDCQEAGCDELPHDCQYDERNLYGQTGLDQVVTSINPIHRWR